MSIYFKWTKDVSVNNEVIDFQHKKLLEEINKIIEALVFGVESDKVGSNIFSFLEGYIKEHFSYEEKYMAKINYPDIKSHIKKHHNFIKTFNNIKENFKINSNKNELLIQMEKYVGEWWVYHIGKEDKKYYLYWLDTNKRIK